MDIIADTNVWYDLAEKRLDARGVKSQGRLLVTPTSFLELVSKLTVANFSGRQRAAQAVVQHADGVAWDTETRLTQIWGFGKAFHAMPWHEGFGALAEACDLASLRRGVPDTARGIGRTIDFQLARAWREQHWGSFQRQVEEAIDTDFPGYKKARAKGRNKHMSAAARGAFEKKLSSAAFRTAILTATYRRALLAAGLPPAPPDGAAFKAAEVALSAYVSVYAQYLLGCACEFAPAPNDLGDLECFVYVGADTHVLTAEKRWQRLAAKAGVPHLLVKA